MSPTQTITMLPAEPVLAKLEELQAMLARTLETAAAADTPAWLPLAKLCAHFGLSKKTIQRHLIHARYATALRVLEPSLPDGTKCHPLYNVADFTAWLARCTPAEK